MFRFFRRKQRSQEVQPTPEQSGGSGAPADDMAAAVADEAAGVPAAEAESAQQEPSSPAVHEGVHPPAGAVAPEAAGVDAGSTEPSAVHAPTVSESTWPATATAAPAEPAGAAAVAPVPQREGPPSVAAQPATPATVGAEGAEPAALVGGAPVERPRRFLLPRAPEKTGAPEPSRKSWLDRLRSGLSRTGQSFAGLFSGVRVDESLFEELETALIMSDAGMEATAKLLEALRARVRGERIDDGQKVKQVLQELLTEHLTPLQHGFDIDRGRPLVIMIAGVNGAGKTTSIGKLARTFQACGKSVLLAAGDTFRAAAREQLVEWGERNNVAVIAQREGADPAAVAFDAVQAGKARGVDIVMIDTAGRLPTQLHLMAELQKIRRVLGKADPSAPHEVLLVVDGNTGQNALAQIKAFDDALSLTGLVVTKLDGTAKGGILAAVAAGSQGVRPVPVYWIGVGEGPEDLQPFVASEFAQAMLGND